MPDTVYYFNPGNVPHADSLTPDSSTVIVWIPETDTHVADAQDNSGAVFIFFLLGLLAYAIRRAGLKNARKRQDAVTAPLPESNEANEKYWMYKGTDLIFSDEEIIVILNKYYSYYVKLNAVLQDLFVQRVKRFMKEKYFVIHCHDPYKEMPVLFSATAVQITFGLADFTFPYYRYICIHPKEYFAENSLHVLEGNVQGNSITIAWNYFMEGLKDADDGANVGLHEMAHALYFQQIIVNNKKSAVFAKHFDEVIAKGTIVFDMKKSATTIFSAYAFTDLQELWAESVELFFEKPAIFKANYPDLFDALCFLLQQNPLDAACPCMQTPTFKETLMPRLISRFLK